MFSNKKYVIDKGNYHNLIFRNLELEDHDWCSCDQSYHFTEFILKKLLIFKYLKVNDSKINEMIKIFLDGKDNTNTKFRINY